MPMILSPCLTAPRYSSNPLPKFCHQTFNQTGKTKSGCQRNWPLKVIQQVARLSKLSWVMLTCISVASSLASLLTGRQ